MLSLGRLLYVLVVILGASAAGVDQRPDWQERLITNSDPSAGRCVSIGGVVKATWRSIPRYSLEVGTRTKRYGITAGRSEALREGYSASNRSVPPHNLHP